MLFRFLKFGYESDLASPTVTDLQKPLVDCRPCLYCLPRKYWQDTRDCVLVKNGTKAIVFHVTLQVVRKIWDQLKRRPAQWRELESWATNEQPGKHYYVKIRTADMHPAALVNKLAYALSDLADEDPTFQSFTRFVQ